MVKAKSFMNGRQSSLRFVLGCWIGRKYNDPNNIIMRDTLARLFILIEIGRFLWLVFLANVFKHGYERMMIYEFVDGL